MEPKIKIPERDIIVNLLFMIVKDSGQDHLIFKQFYK